MKTNTALILKILLVLSWIIFVGLCVEAGGFIANAIFALANPDRVQYLWHEVNLNNLFQYDYDHYFAMATVMSIVTMMKACLFYLILKLLHDKKLNLAQPFNQEMARFITSVSFLTLLIGLFSWSGVQYAEWLAEQGVHMPDPQALQLGGADVWLFMSITIFVIAQIFKRGIEIQTENELTV